MRTPEIGVGKTRMMDQAVAPARLARTDLEFQQKN